VGLAGHRGSGNRQVAEALLGAIERQGEVRVGGRVLPPGQVHEAIRAGVGYVPGDRHRQGLVPALGVDDNIGMPRLYALRLAGLVRPAARRRLAERLIELVGVVPPQPSLPVGGLSGGNQQKVVLGRALSTDPTVLVLVHPTAGVDVASREAIFAKIREACGRGAAALVVSDEVEELQVCDRVLAMFEGRIVAEFREGWRDRDVVEAMEGGAESPAAAAKETG
jgi:simple sugar transport system ATP-binding protein